VGADLVLRAARTDEVAALAELHAWSWRVTYGPMLTPDEAALLTVEERRGLWRRALGAPAAREAVLVAVEAGRVVGLVLAGPSHDDDGGPDVGEIHAIHVEPGRHGQGIGGQLLGGAVGHLRAAGFTRATLWVIRDNDVARRFYEGQGWSPDGTAKRGPMGDFEGLPFVDEVRYRRSLAEDQSR
jgi:ribosomal protein S18 acetylase RimI-like enzyme